MLVTVIACVNKKIINYDKFNSLASLYFKLGGCDLGGGALPVMDYTGGFAQKGYPFQAGGI